MMTWQLRHEWPIRKIESEPQLAELLELSLGQLRWLADTRGLERTVADEQLRNYRYALVPRRGGVPRVIEAPKARLKEIQRWILREILVHVPVHPAAHGFVPQRSVITAARSHVGREVVLRLDLKDFFASVAVRRVFGVFTTLGYQRELAYLLAGLSTNVIPQMVWTVVQRQQADSKPESPKLVQARHRLGRQLATPHLPQGAPTSPALANLVAFRLDRRLTGLAHRFGANYTRYADDLTFSGSMALLRRRALFEQLALEIVRSEGFLLNEEKSLLRTRASRQAVCGVVVNVRPNLVRGEYEQLKAILHNCARFGPSTQNRDGHADLAAHLRGRIAWVTSLNPDRGLKLRRQFNAIDWSR